MCWHLLIFPGRHQPSIFSTTDLNFCVRNGNRCTLGVINTNYFYYIHFFIIYSCWRLLIFPGRHQPSIFSTTDLNFCVRNGNRCTLSVINTNLFIFNSNGDSYGNRTRVTSVRGRCLNRLTNEPYLWILNDLADHIYAAFFIE